MSTEKWATTEAQQPSPEGLETTEKTAADAVTGNAPEPEETEAQPEGEAPAQGMDAGDRVAALEEEVADYKDRHMRAAAELQNYMKRTSRQMDEMRKYANEAILRELLPVVDNLERALSIPCESDDAKGIAQGVDLTLRETLRVFEKFNVKPIEAMNQPFDPNFHQAVSREERNDCPDNTVVSEFQKGYLIHDRLLRPAMVVVSMASKETEAPDTGE